MGVDNRPEWARFMAYDNIFRDGSEMSTEIVDIEGHYLMGDGKLHFQLGTTTGEGENRDLNATANQFFLAAIAIRYHLTPFRTQK